MLRRSRIWWLGHVLRMASNRIRRHGFQKIGRESVVDQGIPGVTVQHRPVEYQDDMGQLRSVDDRSLWTVEESKGKGSPYSITERRVLELIPVLGSQPADYVSHKPSGRLPLLFARPAVTPATLKRAATSFAAWWTEAQWV